MTWIKCSERMPVYFRDVIFFHIVEGVLAGYMVNEKIFMEFRWQKKLNTSDVTHWMYLPEAPKEVTNL